MHTFVMLLSLCYIARKVVIGSDDEYRLLQDLRKNYDPHERPVLNHSEPIVIKLRILLQQLVDVDEKNQVITLVIWMQQMWNDYKMKWDPKEYGGITNIRFASSSNDLWKPDVLLFNSADDKFDANFPVNFVVKYTGDVLFAPPGIVKSSCQIDITWFPFDEQLCYLKYGSWTYTGHQVDLLIDDPGVDKNNQMDLKYYLANGEWDLLATPADRKVSEFEGEKYVELYFHMHFRRKTMYYGLNWIIPSVIISLSNLLGLERRI
ncbi:Neuronal acetylcholine receptor subunit eat-2 [Toxocara canis]|uniref:Neuronal acetylcholine receptor subunit eat-2 n=1 Tax=Toxocara canis TaxID=6265 RepID=A0A0B2UVS1_TOXCA|nr:Neuronal acetylcholine receptor subunit eat-2 [Toxocara canis]